MQQFFFVIDSAQLSTQQLSKLKDILAKQGASVHALDFLQHLGVILFMAKSSTYAHNSRQGH